MSPLRCHFPRLNMLRQWVAGGGVLLRQCYNNIALIRGASLWLKKKNVKPSLEFDVFSLHTNNQSEQQQAAPGSPSPWRPCDEGARCNSHWNNSKKNQIFILKCWIVALKMESSVPSKSNISSWIFNKRLERRRSELRCPMGDLLGSFRRREAWD